jgi:hypothetical protein
MAILLANEPVIQLVAWLLAGSLLTSLADGWFVSYFVVCWFVRVT